MKIALITGASRGIGAECVKTFAKNGYTVILNYNTSKTQAENLRNQLLEKGCDVHLYQADVSNESQVKQMFLWVEKYFKHIDVLVNNAGICVSGLLQDVEVCDYERVMDTNAKGTFLCCKYALPLLKNSSNSGIVNVSSIWGLQGSACESVYCMSKFAVVGLTQSLAKELECTNVRVNCICPPMVLTEMTNCYTQKEIDEFCQAYGKKAYTASQVALQIYSIATSNENGFVLEL